MLALKEEELCGRTFSKGSRIGALKAGELGGKTFLKGSRIGAGGGKTLWKNLHDGLQNWLQEGGEASEKLTPDLEKMNSMNFAEFNSKKDILPNL